MKKSMFFVTAVFMIMTNAVFADSKVNGDITIEIDRNLEIISSNDPTHIFYYSSVIPKACHTVLGREIALGEMSKLIETKSIVISNKDNNRLRYFYSVTINLPDTPPTQAEQLLSEIVKELQATLDTAYKSDIEILVEKQKDLAEKVAVMKDEWGAKNKAYADLPLMGNNIELQITAFNEQIEKLTLFLQSSEEKMRILDVQKLHISEQMKLQEQGDAIIDQLRQLVIIEEQRLEKIKEQRDAGSASNSEVQEAERNLIRAQIELARRQEQGESEAKKELADITKQMAEVSMDVSQMELERKQLMGKRDRALESLTRSHEYKILKLELKYAERNYIEALEKLQRLQEQIDNSESPTVTVLGV